MKESIHKFFSRSKKVVPTPAEEALTADPCVPRDFKASLANPRPPDALRPDFDPYLADAIEAEGPHALRDLEDEPEIVGDAQTA